MDVVYSKNPDVVFRKIAGEFILVPIRQKAVDLKSIFTLNEAAAFIWSLLDDKLSLSQIKDKVIEQFEVDSSQAEVDILAILSECETLQLIQKS